MKLKFYRSPEPGEPAGGSNEPSTENDAPKGFTADVLELEDDLKEVLNSAKQAPAPETPPVQPAPVVPKPATASPAPAAAAAPASATAPAAAEPEGEITYRNHTDLILNRVLGLETETVMIGDQEVSIADLTEEQNAEVLAEAYTTLLEGLNNGPQDENEFNLLQALRQNNGSATALAEFILQNDATYQARNMSDEDLVKEFYIKKNNPGFEDADVEAELEFLKERNAIERHAKAIRANLGTGTGTVPAPAAQAPQTDAEFETQLAELRNTVYQVKEFAGFTLDQQHLAETAAFVAEVDATGDTAFVRELENPANLTKAALWYRYGEPALQMERQRAIEIGQTEYARGRREALDGAPNAPITNASVANNSTAQRPKEFDIDNYSPTQIGT